MYQRIYPQSLLFLFSIFTMLFCNNDASTFELNIGGRKKIQGGHDAYDGQFPYHISMELLGKSICGGSILDESFVITAAHCVIREDGSFNKYPLKVVGGISDLKSKSNRYRVSVDVIEIFVPKEYDPTLRKQRKRPTGDIAVLKLNEDLGIKRNLMLDKVKLPNKDENYDGVMATVTGFGHNSAKIVTRRTSPNTSERIEVIGRQLKKLRYAVAETISFKHCQYYFTQELSEKHICAAILQPNRDEPEGVCSKDSGGPLVYDGIQIGIVSASPLGCREDSEPAVYTRVSSFIDFIKKVIGGNIDESIRSITL